MPATVGERLAAARYRAGLTQEQLAEHAGLSVETVRKVEQGERIPRLRTLSMLARALSTTTSSLLGDASTGTVRRTPDRDQLGLLELRRVLTPARGLGGIDIVAGQRPVGLAELRAAISATDRAYHDDDYATALAALPALISDAREAAETATAAQRGQALSLLAATYQVAGTALIQLRSLDLAYQALSAGLDAADDAGDELAGVSTIVTLCWLLLRQGRVAEVEELAIRTADQIEPRFSRLDPPRLAAWGWLLLRGAAAASRDNRDDDAAGMLDAAAAAAARIGDRVPDGALQPGPVSIGAFCPTTVGMKRVETAIMAGDAAGALTLAARVPPGGRATSNNLNRFRLDVACAHAMQGEHRAAVETLRAIHRDAPLWLRHQRYGRDIVRRLASARRRAASREIAELASFVGAVDLGG
jgi:transcriptional regulator with XRE-family HTH domain